MTRIAEAEALRAARPDQATAVASVTLPAQRVPDAEFAALMERLRAAVASRPDDITGLALLARNEASLGNLDAALAAQQALIRAKATAVTAQDHADLAEMMIAAAGGYVSPEAEDVLTAALTLDPMNETARFYAGLMLGQVGRYDLGFRMWRPLADGLADQPWVAAFRARMPDMAARAGVDFTLTGPSAADIAAAADMTAEDRAAMIAGMVTQLSDRLATEGGTAREWAQLIDALQVLGETDRAATILAEARTVFAGDAESLTIIDAAAAP
jgi:cytochrome c-type biogenesis protein CcmH